MFSSFRLTTSIFLLLAVLSHCQPSGNLSMSEEASSREAFSALSPTSFSVSSPLAALPSSSSEIISFRGSSGGQIRFSQEGDSWYGSTSEGRFPVQHNSSISAGSYLSWLSDQEASVVRSRVHVIPSSASPTGESSVYLGRLGLMGGMQSSAPLARDTSAPVWLSATREKQVHSVVTVGPDKEVNIRYVIRRGWRCISYFLRTVQENPHATSYVEELQQDFAYTHSDHEVRGQHHTMQQGISGPSVEIPSLGVEADLQLGQQAQQGQGMQQYTTQSARTTHDVLRLVASVPATYRKKKKFGRGYKDKPVLDPLKVQLGVILERMSSDEAILSPRPSLAAYHPPAPAPVSSTTPKPPSVSGKVSASSTPPSTSGSSRPTMTTSSTQSSFVSEVTTSSQGSRTSSRPPAFSLAPLDAGIDVKSLLRRKLDDPDAELSEAESIALLTHCVHEGELNAEKIRGKDALMVIGNTGAGKSTCLNYLIGCKLEGKNPHELGLDGLEELIVIAPDSPLGEVMPISHEETSKTFIPQVEASRTDPSIAYCDCPGFLDNRGAEINIANAVNIRRTLQAARSVKTLILINYHSLLADRSRGLRETLSICSQLFGKPANLERYQSSLLLGVTKSPVGMSLEGMRAFIAKSNLPIVEVLSKRVFLYDPLDRGNADFWVHAQFVRAIDELQGIPQRESDKLFRTVLTDGDERKLLDIVEKQSKDLEVALHRKQYVRAAGYWRSMHRLSVIDHYSVERLLNTSCLKLQKMLSRKVGEFRKYCMDYRFREAEIRLDELRELSSHFSKEDLYRLELDVTDLGKLLVHFKDLETKQLERDRLFAELEGEVSRMEEAKRLLEETYRSQQVEFSKAQSALRAEMVRRDGDHEAQISKIKEEYQGQLQKQAEDARLQKTVSEEDRLQREKEEAKLRRAYENRLAAAEQEQRSAREEYEQRFKEQETRQLQKESELQAKLTELEGKAKEAKEAEEHARREEALRRRQSALPEEAFGAKAWKEYFGVKVDDEPALPRNIEAILNKKAPFTLEHETSPQRIRDNHVLFLVPSQVNGEPLSLNKLGELSKHYFPGNEEGYRHYDSTVRSQFGGKTPSKSYWCLLTRTVLSGSRSKNYSDQKALLSQYSRQGYGLPSGLEASTGIMVHYARSRERLYGDAPRTYTRCAAEELVGGKCPLLGASGRLVPVSTTTTSVMIVITALLVAGSSRPLVFGNLLWAGLGFLLLRSWELVV